MNILRLVIAGIALYLAYTVFNAVNDLATTIKTHSDRIESQLR